MNNQMENIPQQLQLISQCTKLDKIHAQAQSFFAFLASKKNALEGCVQDRTINCSQLSPIVLAIMKN